jgi:uncharacterized coiled-coil DUF342 family protein
MRQSSTIAGIFSRVIVQQFRNDPADIEDRARRELGEAVRLLRASLLQSVSNMNSTSKAANIAMTEIMARTRKTTEETAEENIQLTSRLSRNVDEFSKNLTDAMTEVTIRTRKSIEETAEQNMELMSRLAHKVDTVTNNYLDQASSVSEGLKGLADELNAELLHMAEQSRELSIDGSPLRQELEFVTTEFSDLRQKVQNTKEGCQSFSEELSILSKRIGNLLSDEFLTHLQSVEDDVLGRRNGLASQHETPEDNPYVIKKTEKGLWRIIP